MPNTNIYDKNKAIDKIETFLGEAGFRCMRQWKDDGHTFTSYQLVNEKEVATVLIHDFGGNKGIEVYVNATGSIKIDETIWAIKKRFDLTEN